MTRLLILGGTAEAAALAAQASARFGPRLEVISALAGCTATPRAIEGKVRVGGFGGADGLADYLRAERIGLVIDATHPFAETISRHAAAACAAAGVPHLALVRPAWRAGAGDDWRRVADGAAAAEAVEQAGARRVFLSIGSRGVDAFTRLAEVFFLVRAIEPPAAPLPLARHRLILARGPFSLDDEIALIKQERIELVVSRASGGAATQAKLLAARALGIPVVMIERPKPPPGETVDSVEAALGWIAARSQDM
ncbi:MAG: cobalt-precorrin-6A reductase [Alphaproteobacteria bacterium]